MKALKWDGDGFLIYVKRLSQGRFREVLKKGDDGVPIGHIGEDVAVGGSGCRPAEAIAELAVGSRYKNVHYISYFKSIYSAKVVIIMLTRKY